jgi:hypothetical protein
VRLKYLGGDCPIGACRKMKTGVLVGSGSTIYHMPEAAHRWPAVLDAELLLSKYSLGQAEQYFLLRS